MRKQDQQIKNAKEIRKKWKYEAPVISMSNKLNQIIDDFTDEKEKSDMKLSVVDSQINVPVHLALNQCVISSIKDQFKVVNKCMLHMMYRKLNLLAHLKSLKLFYLSGQGDIMDHFASLLFYMN